MAQTHIPLGNFSLPIEANEGVEERLNVSLSRNEGRAVPCSTEVKEGWGEGPLKNLIPRELKNSKTHELKNLIQRELKNSKT